jgi:Mn-containing catalase
VPLDMSHIYASGNLAADMHCNVAAETTGRVLAVRLFNATRDHGMKDMLHFMIARDTTHQKQWLAVLEELGGLRARCQSRTASPKQGRSKPQLRFLQYRSARLGCARGPFDARAIAGRQGKL